MFTGLVENLGIVRANAPVSLGGAAGGRRLTVSSALFVEPAPLGASVAIDGVCLTVVSWQTGEAQFDVGPETLERSTLGGLTVGTRCNLERALRLGDRLGGHLVAGHVDGVGLVAERHSRGESLDIRITVPAPLLRYVVEKGSICIDGISLTVNAVDRTSLTVSLIPHTQHQTTLSEKPVGAALNLEVDLIGKYVEKLVAPYAPGPAADERLRRALKEAGFDAP